MLFHQNPKINVNDSNILHKTPRFNKLQMSIHYHQKTWPWTDNKKKLKSHWSIWNHNNKHYNPNRQKTISFIFRITSGNKPHRNQLDNSMGNLRVPSPYPGAVAPEAFSLEQQPLSTSTSSCAHHGSKRRGTSCFLLQTKLDLLPGREWIFQKGSLAHGRRMWKPQFLLIATAFCASVQKNVMNHWFGLLLTDGRNEIASIYREQGFVRNSSFWKLFSKHNNVDQQWWLGLQANFLRNYYCFHFCLDRQ